MKHCVFKPGDLIAGSVFRVAPPEISACYGRINENNKRIGQLSKDSVALVLCTIPEREDNDEEAMILTSDHTIGWISAFGIERVT